MLGDDLLCGTLGSCSRHRFPLKQANRNEAEQAGHTLPPGTGFVLAVFDTTAGLEALVILLEDLPFLVPVDDRPGLPEVVGRFGSQQDPVSSLSASAPNAMVPFRRERRLHGPPRRTWEPL